MADPLLQSSGTSGSTAEAIPSPQPAAAYRNASFRHQRDLDCAPKKPRFAMPSQGLRRHIPRAEGPCCLAGLSRSMRETGRAQLPRSPRSACWGFNPEPIQRRFTGRPPPDPRLETGATSEHPPGKFLCCWRLTHELLIGLPAFPVMNWWKR